MALEGTTITQTLSGGRLTPFLTTLWRRNLALQFSHVLLPQLRLSKVTSARAAQLEFPLDWQGIVDTWVCRRFLKAVRWWRLEKCVKDQFHRRTCGWNIQTGTPLMTLQAAVDFESICALFCVGQGK